MSDYLYDLCSIYVPNIVRIKLFHCILKLLSLIYCTYKYNYFYNNYPIIRFNYVAKLINQLIFDKVIDIISHRS